MAVYKSFKEMGTALGHKEKEKEKKEQKELKCRVCGRIMERISGTNIIKCPGGEYTDKDGNSKNCHNFMLSNYTFE